MKRREFLHDSIKYMSLGLGLPLVMSLAACGGGNGNNGSTRNNPDDQPGDGDPGDGLDPGGPGNPADKERALIDMQIFGFYQAYTDNETLANRDLSRTDGTKSGVLTAAQVEANEPLTLNFWHGHGATHTFGLGSEQFDKLRQGETVYVLTSSVAGHKHCARIVPVFA